MVKQVTKSPVQKDIEAILEEINNAVLGYAMMVVMDDRDLGRGPGTVARSINIRSIDDKYLKDFAVKVKKQGLHNRSAEYAIVVGVKPSYIVSSSLQPLKGGVYDNHVQWTNEGKQDDAKMILYNGNHRRAYMREHSNVVEPYMQYKKGLAEKHTETDPDKQFILESTISKARKEVEEHGTWLVKFIDSGKYNICGRPHI